MQNGDTRLSYTYDAVGNIETISENGELKAKYYYDELSQLVREDNKELNQTIVYEYDQGGNIQSKTRYAYTEGELGEAVGTDTYSYQAEDLWADVLTGYNGQKFTYDEIGNPLTYRDGMGFSWQYGRQMETAITEEEVIGYWYNADGIRTKKIRSNGEVTDYYLNGSNIITMITNSVMDPENPKRLDFYYDEQGTLLGFQYNGQDYWYIQNGQGDIVGILDSTGAQVVSYAYDSWGVPISVTGSMADTIGEINPFRYRGYYYDSETGLYYLNSRYYDPVVGRFINADGLVVAGSGMLSGNMYLYCQNNPICCVDPTGALGSFFDVPLSMADRMQMSQSMLDNYYAAKATASATSPSPPSISQEIGNSISNISSVLMGCATVAVADGPAPFLDVPALIMATVVIIGAVAVGIYNATTNTNTDADSKEKEATLTPSSPTVIFRYGGTNPGNFVPTARDVSTNTGLSFSTVPRAGAAMTTIEALNATGVVYAVQDGATHVSVKPIGGTIAEWRNAGSSSVWTQAIKSVVVKWDGGN